MNEPLEPADTASPAKDAPTESPAGTADPGAAQPLAASTGVVAVPGERLGVPLGATRVFHDYGRPAPSYVFLLGVSIVTFAADIGSKSWAEHHLDGYPGIVEVWKNHLTLILAKNRGGAWGLLQSTSENVRRPFFLLVSVAAIAFIMTLYRRLQPRQTALKWGLPFVLGGALGNVFDRIRYGHVIDFIDAHVTLHNIEHHWPTFNVADIAICVGVGLMAVDMFSSKRGPTPILRASPVPPAQSGEPIPEAYAWYAHPTALSAAEPSAHVPAEVEAVAPPPGTEPPATEPPAVEPHP